MTNRLYYGDNLDVLRGAIASDRIDLVYLEQQYPLHINTLQPKIATDIVSNMSNRSDKADPRCRPLMPVLSAYKAVEGG